MSQVAEVLTQEWYLKRAGKDFTQNDFMDASCIAQHALGHAGLLSHFFSYHTGPAGKPLFVECHTNGGCNSPAAFREKAVFVNIQGPGVSAEYKEDPSKPSPRKAFTDWFQSMYPEPSRFE